MNPKTEIQTILKELGFTDLEADIYLYLLQNSPATGYKIAKGIDRSFAITYRALNTLQTKGAIMVEAGKNRRTCAVPIQEFMQQKEAQFSDRKKRILEAVRQLPECVHDNRIYQITSLEQVYERCKGMLESAQQRVLIELFPEPIGQLQTTLSDIASRGIDVTARVYSPTTIPGIQIIQSPIGQQTIQAFNSQWLALFVDGRQFLLAQLMADNSGVHYAVFSSNLILSRAMYSYVNSDFHHYSFREILFSSDSIEEARTIYQQMEQMFPPGGDAGFQELISQFNDGDSHEAQ